MRLSDVDVIQMATGFISAIATTVCAVMAIRDRVHRRSRGWGLGACVFGAILVIGLGFFVWRWLHPIVTIAYPSSGAMVDQTEEVNGTSQSLFRKQVIWVVIYSHKVGRFYPQNQPAEIQVRGTWYSRVYFGVPADSGQDFDVLAVVPDADAQDAFWAYLEEYRDRPDAPGFEALPAGAVIYDRLTVTRKSDTVSLIRETTTARCRGHGTVGGHV